MSQFLDQALYDSNKTWEENLSQGPRFSGDYPERLLPPKEDWLNFLGHSVASPLGVPAGPLLNSDWIQCASALGYDILTYKTIRSHAHPAHPLPNIVYMDCPPDIPMSYETPTFRKRLQSPGSLEELAITNSFGNPSMAPDYLEADLARAKACLNEGQVLVASVFGSTASGKAPIDDFLDAAALAKGSGVEVIEANFSCPNVGKGEGALYQDAETSEALARAIVEVVHPLPLIIKVGSYADLGILRKVLVSLARAGVRAISGINTVSAKALDQEGHPALDLQRPTGGICGSPIRGRAKDFISNAHQIIQDEKLDLTLIGVGGVIAPEHVDEFRHLGADFVQTATGMMWDPLLAHRYHQSHSTLVVS